MNIFILIAHPGKRSFNHALADRVCEKMKQNGHKIFYHDLYAERFDPILPEYEIPKNAKLDPVISSHCSELSNSDGIIIIHPNWWGQPPAILKGWIDRVLRPGVAYEFLERDSGEGIPKGLLKARAAIVFNTSNTSADREDNLFKDPLQTIWQNCIFDLCGVKKFHRKMFRIIVTGTEEQRDNWLKEAETLVDQCFPGAERIDG